MYIYVESTTPLYNIIASLRSSQVLNLHLYINWDYS